MNEFDRLEYQKRILDWAEPIILSLPSAMETVTNLQESLGEPKTDGRDQEVLLNNGEKFPNYNEDKGDR